MSFTPCSSRGVNRTTPTQKPFCRGMLSFNFRTAVRLCPGAPADAPRTLSATAPATGQTRLLAVLTPKTRIRPISLPTRHPKRPFPGKTLPCRFPKHQYRQSECQHGKKLPVFRHGPTGRIISIIILIPARVTKRAACTGSRECWRACTQCEVIISSIDKQRVTAFYTIFLSYISMYSPTTIF